MNPALLCDTLTVTVPGGTPQTAAGRVEELITDTDNPTGEDRRAEYRIYLAPSALNPDGSTGAVALSRYATLVDQSGATYIAAAVPQAGRLRGGDVDHYEVLAFTLELNRDTVVVQRPDPTTDTEGTPNGPLATVLTTTGTWSSPSPRDQEVAGQRGVILDAVLAMANGVDVRVGDVVTVRGITYDIVAVVDDRFSQRCMLRKVGAF